MVLFYTLIASFVFVFSLMYAIKLLMENSFYAFICGGVASLSLYLLIRWILIYC